MWMVPLSARATFNSGSRNVSRLKQSASVSAAASGLSERAHHSTKDARHAVAQRAGSQASSTFRAMPGRGWSVATTCRVLQ